MMKDSFEIRQELDRIIAEMYNKCEIINCYNVYIRFEPDLLYNELLEFATNEPLYMEKAITHAYYIFSIDEYDYWDHIRIAQSLCALFNIQQAIEDFNIIDNELESIEE